MSNKFTETQIEDIRDSYLAGKSVNAISKDSNLGRFRIESLLKELGIYRTREEAVKVNRLPCNHQYFKTIDTEEKAYWLGFLYADGNTVLEPNPAVQVCLAEADTEQLEAFRKAIGSEHNIGHYNYKNPVCQLRIPSPEMTHDLIQLGCIVKKTFTLTWPTAEQVPEPLTKHFIRGYFDGDGCITHSESRPVVIFLGTKHLVEGILSRIPFPNKINAKPTRNIYRANISLTKVKLPILYDWLYRDATIWLPRKRLRFLSHLSNLDNL